MRASMRVPSSSPTRWFAEQDCAIYKRSAVKRKQQGVFNFPQVPAKEEL